MILITGGLGFIGSHVTRALLDLDETCLVTRRRTTPLPDFLAEEGRGLLLSDPLDVTDRDAFLRLGERHAVTGIVHLAGAGIGALGALEENTRGLFSVLRAAEAWGVPRVGIASTIGVYAGVAGDPLREDAPLPTVSAHAIPAAKKAMEILALRAAAEAGFAVVNLRIAAIWGPLGRAASPFFATPRLVHAAVRGEEPGVTPYAEDGVDMLYAKDCGRAIALLQTAETLRHDTYNVGSGHATTNAEVAAAVRAAVPDARVGLSAGRGPAGAVRLDTARLRADTGFRPRYDVDRAVADYVAWLRAGHDR
jgi:UDP-glucose 4-epimerase